MGRSAPIRAVTIVQLARLGDLAQTWPLILQLQEPYGPTGVALVVDERVAGLARQMVGATNVLALPTQEILTRSIQGMSGTWHSASSIRNQLNDFAARIVISLNYHQASAAIAEAIPADSRLGVRWADVARGIPSDAVTGMIFAATTGQRRGQRHLSDLWREYAGVPERFAYRSLTVSSQTDGAARKLLYDKGVSPDDTLIAVIPGSGLAERAWPVENFRRVIAELPSNATALVIGTAHESQTAEFILAQNHIRAVSLCGVTDSATLAGVLTHCRLAIGTDTGALQVAAMVGCPCLGIYYGSMNFRETGPYGDGHVVVAPDDPLYPYQEWDMERNPSLHQYAIDPEPVFDATKAMLGGQLDSIEYHSGTLVYQSSLTVDGLHWTKMNNSRISSGVSRLRSTVSVA